MQQVEASARVVEELMAEISRELFLNAAVDHVTESESPGGSPAAVVAAAVAPRLEALDDSFLATLDVYIAGAGERGAADVAEVLLMVRDEVVGALGRRLPAEMRLLEAALAQRGASARMALLRRCALPSEAALAEARAAQQRGADAGEAAAAQGEAGGGRGGAEAAPPPLCLASDLERAASQVVGDMELLVEVPDRRLLARLVLVREELQQMLLEASFVSGDDPQPGLRQPYQQLGAVPRSCAAFVQRLVALPGAQERQALLREALSRDVERLPGAGELPPDATRRERARAAAEAPQDWVRPGRFMLSLAALQGELLEQAAARRDAGSGAEGDDAVAGDALLERVEAVRRDALRVLLDIAGDAAEQGSEPGGEAEEPFLP